MMRSHWGHGDITVTFDISRTQEVEPSDFIDKPKQNLGTYRSVLTKGMDDGEYGFTLAGRVPPRNFRGIVVNIHDRRMNHEKSMEYAKKISGLLFSVNADKKGVMVPVYDRHGNILWPVQMSHEEVKKLVAERELKNKEKEEKESRE